MDWPCLLAMQNIGALTSSPRASIRARVGRLICASTLLLLSFTWLLQALIALQANFAEIDTAQRALAISFSQRLEDRLRVLERRLLDTTATLDIASTAESRTIELRRLLRLEPRVVYVQFQVPHELRPVSEGSILSRSSAPLGFETRVGQLELGRAYTPNEMGARVPFGFVRRASADQGSLSGEFSLSLLSELIGQFELESNSSVFVALDDGTVVAHRNQALTGTDQLRSLSERDSSIVAKVLHPFLGESWISHDQFGQRTLVASAKIGNSTWSVFFSRPLGATIARSMNVYLLGILLLAGAIFSAIVASLGLARYVTNPIIDLRKAVADHATNLEILRPASVRDDEVGQLFDSFSRLVGDVVHANAQLERRVFEKTRDLADANAELGVASKHKSDFLAHMSHELRTPLNAVIGFSEMLKAQYFGPLNEKQAEYVKDINDSGQHLLALINEILDLAKVEAGRVAYWCRSGFSASGRRSMRSWSRQFRSGIWTSASSSSAC